MGGIEEKLTGNLQITVLQFTGTKIGRLSSVKCSPSKLQDGASPWPKKYPICIITGIETDKDQPKQLCKSETFTQITKFVVTLSCYNLRWIVGLKLIRLEKKHNFLRLF